MLLELQRREIEREMLVEYAKEFARSLECSVRERFILYRKILAALSMEANRIDGLAGSIDLEGKPLMVAIEVIHAMKRQGFTIDQIRSAVESISKK